MISNSISAPCIAILVFIHWKKGPEWWLKISPKIYFCFLITIFIILPIFNVGLAIIFFIVPSFNLTDQPIESFCVLFFVLYLIRIAEFFTWVKRSVVDDARIYLENLSFDKDQQKILAEDADKEDLLDKKKAKVLEQMEASLTYLTRQRQYGNGEVRIGKNLLEFSEDIYSLCYVSQVHDFYMD